jgi:hypothetical protein
MKKESQIKLLEIELKPLLDPIGRAMDTILLEGISEYPIIVVHQNPIELGVDILGGDQPIRKWKISASTLEEFTAKRLIQNDKVEEFKTVYKDPGTHLCMFIVHDNKAEFVFRRRDD